MTGSNKNNFGGNLSNSSSPRVENDIEVQESEVNNQESSKEFKEPQILNFNPSSDLPNNSAQMIVNQSMTEQLNDSMVHSDTGSGSVSRNQSTNKYKRNRDSYGRRNDK